MQANMHVRKLSVVQFFDWIMVLAKQQTIKLIQKLKNKYILQLYPVGAAYFPKQTLLEYGKFLQSGAWYRVEEDHG